MFPEASWLFALITPGRDHFCCSWPLTTESARVVPSEVYAPLSKVTTTMSGRSCEVMRPSQSSSSSCATMGAIITSLVYGAAGLPHAYFTTGWN